MRNPNNPFNKKPKKVSYTETTIKAKCLQVDPEMDSYRPVKYEFNGSGATVIVREKRDPYNDNEKLRIER